MRGTAYSGLLPLADVTVLAIEQFGAGPWATLQFADLGAEVIKVEDPRSGGDVGRYVPPYQEGEDSLYFESFNRNKQSVSLDLRTEAGREVLRELVRGVDALFSNLRGDRATKLGLTYGSLSELNPRIVCCALSGFGATGPRAAQPGYDAILQGISGWMALTGEPDGPPEKSGLSLVDFAAGYVAALSMLAGIWRARRDGVGCDCDVSLFETALSQLNYIGTWAASRGFVPRRMPGSGHQSIVPFQAFEAADGWITVACPKEHFWVQLCRTLGRDDLLADQRFDDFAARDRHREELLEELNRTFAAGSAAHWVALLEAAGVPAGPVNEVGAALKDPQVAARQAIIEIEHPVLGTVSHVASPLKVGGFTTPARPGPRRGGDTDAVLARRCGYGLEDIARLRAARAFGEAAT